MKSRRSLTLFLAGVVLLTARALAEPSAEPQTPVEVVKAYLAADARGFALTSDDAKNTLKYTTSTDAPGWDAFSVTEAYSCKASKESDNNATVEVTYQNLGVISGFNFKSDPGKEVVTYKLVKEGDAWKIDEPQLQPHVASSVAMKYLQSNRDDEARSSIQRLRKAME